METRLRLLYALQQIDNELDEVQELKGDLPRIVEELQARLVQKAELQKQLEELVKQTLVQRDQTDLEILSLRENVEKYKTQQFQIKTNKQYDALAREIDMAQERINKLEREIEQMEGKANVAKLDAEKLTPEIEELKAELEERQAELKRLNAENEDDELRLRHEREKIVVRINKNDLKTYEKIRKAKKGKAVVPVRRNACGGCFNRVPPQVILELRKNSRVILCEHCGRILVSDEIVETFSTLL